MSQPIESTPQAASAAGQNPAAAEPPPSAGVPAEWPDLDTSLLEDGRPVLPAFPIDIVPQEWNGWMREAASGAGAPVDYVAQAVLAAVAGLCGAGVRAFVTEPWSEPLVLWQVLVGASGSGKTPALDTVGRPLGTIEKIQQRDGRGRDFVVRQATPGALGKAVMNRPSGVLLWRDVHGPWLHALVREAARETARGSSAVDWWSPGSLLPASAVGTLHPDALAEALQGLPDSLAARFLFAWPAPAPLSLRGEIHQHDNDAVVRLQRLAAIVGEPEKPLVLTFDAPARESLELVIAHQGKAGPGAEGVEAAWIGKGRGTVVRLAAILALLDWSRHVAPPRPPSVITRDHVEAASRLWRSYFLPHARAVLARGASSDLDRQVRRAALWLRAGATTRPQVTRQEVRIQALGKTANGSRTDQVLTRLAALGFVRPAAHEPPPQGGRPPHRWEVNPILATT